MVSSACLLNFKFKLYLLIITFLVFFFRLYGNVFCKLKFFLTNNSIHHHWHFQNSEMLHPRSLICIHIHTRAGFLFTDFYEAPPTYPLRATPPKGGERSSLRRQFASSATFASQSALVEKPPPGQQT